MAAYNPRANGSAERAVQDAQNALHKILNGKMHDWDLFLPTVQLAMNSKANRSTKTSPASLLFGVDINAFANYDKATAKLLTHQQLTERHCHIADLIRPGAAAHFRKAQQARTDAANARLRLTSNIPTGTMVMLKDPTRSSKHEPPWIGPFRVVERSKGGNYTLQGLDYSLYHQRPPRDRLKVIDAKADISLNDIYFVETILDHRQGKQGYEYLIKWQNFPTSDNSWEPEKNLLTCDGLVRQYWSYRKANPHSSIPRLSTTSNVNRQDQRKQPRKSTTECTALATPATAQPQSTSSFGRARATPARFLT